MFTITVKGNTIEELFINIKNFLATKPDANPLTANTAPVQSVPVVPVTTPATYAPAPVNPTPPSAVASAIPPLTVQPTPVAVTAPVTPTPVTPAANPVPTAVPAYTIEQLARAGAALAQSGKMEQALALLAKYGVQAVGQLQPEQYGAFATELRALGAQV